MNKTKRQLRAEAVERLRKIPPQIPAYTRPDFVATITGFKHGNEHTLMDVLNALIDLLEDDDMDSAVCVQKCPNDELPEGDAVSILRRAADSDTPMVSLCDRFDAAPLLPSEHSRVFGQLIDMIERDYVSREVYDSLKKLSTDSDAWLKRKVDELTAERDKLRDEYDKDVLVIVDELDRWKTRAIKLEAERDELEAFSERLETAAHDKLGVTLFGVDYVTEDFMLHVRDTLTAERDEWKAKALDYEHKLNVELACSDKSIIEALESHNRELAKERDEWKAKAEQAQESYLDAKESRDKLMGELWAKTDAELREGSSKVRVCQSNLYVIDEHNLRRLYHLGYMDCKQGCYNMPASGLARIEFRELSEESRSAKRAAAAERLKNDIRARFSPDAIVCALLDGRRGKIDWSLECEAILDLLTDKPMDAQRDSNGTCPDAMGQSSTQSKAQSKTEPILTEQSESLSDESCRQYADQGEREEAPDCENDSREKLEADVDNYRAVDLPSYLRVPYDVVIGWLDRQAEITRKAEQAAWIQQANGEIYQAKAERDRALARVDELQGEIEKRDKGIERLKKRRNELQARVDYLENLYGEPINARISKLLRQRDEAMAERDELQGAYDELTGIAADLCRACGFAMVDASGEAVA